MPTIVNGAVYKNDRHAPIFFSNSKKQFETFNMESSSIENNERNKLFLSVNEATLL